MLNFRARTLLYIALFSAFILVWRLTHSTPNVAPARATAAPEHAAEAQPAPTASAPGAVNSVEMAVPRDEGRPLLLGGLASVAESDPLAAQPTALETLLRQRLSATLLDPVTGQADNDSLATGWSVSGDEITFTLRETVDSDNLAPLFSRAAIAGALPALAGISVETGAIRLEVEAMSCPAIWRFATWPILVDDALPTGDDRWQLGTDEAAWDYQQFTDEESLREAWAAGEIGGVVGAQALTAGPTLAEGRSSTPSGERLAALFFRLDDALLGDPTLREALSLATDRTALYADSYQGEAALLTALLPPGHWAAPPTPLDHDVPRADALLDEAGWQRIGDDGFRRNIAGKSLTIEMILPLSQDARWEAMAQRLAAQWAAIGVQLKPIFLESYTVQERLQHDKWQVALLAYDMSGDPDQRTMWAAPPGEDQNVTGFDNPAVADALDAAATLPDCDFATQQARYQAAWQGILDEHVILPLFALPPDLWLHATTTSGS
ncbi:MAG: hypothetical protein KDD73_13115 [Anaerolineales bacterium]|nr:hypothetical protein [Anaerolineales bacterium]MCB9128580.1 hypothetical protein [Ardenticatenales bacterium]